MSGKGADAGLFVDHLQQGDGGAFFAAAMSIGMKPVPFPMQREMTAFIVQGD